MSNIDTSMHNKRRVLGRMMAALAALLPASVSAQAPTNFTEFGELVLRFMSGVISILFALAALGLMWGVIVYFANSDNAQKREQIKPYLFWAVIGITVLFGAWALVGLLYQSLFDSSSWGIPLLSPPQGA